MIFKTREQYREAWNRAYQEDPPVPLNIDIELAAACNLACPMCFWGEADFVKQMSKKAPDGKPVKRLMPTELAIAIIGEAARLGVPALKFNWRGESTLHPDYSMILDYARTMTVPVLDGDVIENVHAFHDLLVNTNGNCNADAIEGLMSATKVMVSLDSLVPATYQRMRVGGHLERACAVIQILIDRGHPDLWVRRVITTLNKDEPFAQDVRALFGPKVKISEHACFDRNEGAHLQVVDPKFERTYCGYPSQRMMIAADGSVFPCCVDYDGTMVMGKFPDQSLAEIWAGKPFRTLRSELRKNFFASDACLKCTSWMAYKAPEREKVQDVEIKI